MGKRMSYPLRLVLREVINSDLPIFFEHQRDPDAARMAAFSSRDHDAFMTHWAKLRREPSNVPARLPGRNSSLRKVHSYEEA